MDAEQIFVVIPGESPDQPYRRVSLQAAFDAFFGLALDLKAQTVKNAEFVAQWPGLVNELTTGVERMQLEFGRIAAELHGTTQVAKAVMTGRRAPKGVN
jgi:hypothetical protein